MIVVMLWLADSVISWLANFTLIFSLCNESLTEIGPRDSCDLVMSIMFVIPN